MNFNINHTVQIRLTDSGRKVYAAYRARNTETFREFNVKYNNVDEHLEDENGWSSWQLWEVMSIFGPFLDHGVNPVFETTIIIPEAS